MTNPLPDIFFALLIIEMRLLKKGYLNLLREFRTDFLFTALLEPRIFRVLILIVINVKFCYKLSTTIKLFCFTRDGPVCSLQRQVNLMNIKMCSEQNLNKPRNTANTETCKQSIANVHTHSHANLHLKIKKKKTYLTLLYYQLQISTTKGIETEKHSFPCWIATVR